MRKNQGCETAVDGSLTDRSEDTGDGTTPKPYDMG